MQNSRKRLALVAPVAVLAVVMAACGGGSSGKGGGGGNNGGGAPKGSIWSSGLSGSVTSVNKATVKPGGQVIYVSEKDFNSGWNLNTSASNIFELGELEENIFPSVYNYNPDLVSLDLNTDLMDSVTQTSTNPQTIVYKIKPAAKWSDGTPIDVNDFIYEWQAQNGQCKTCDILGTTGYDQIDTVTGSDNGKTVTVKFKTPYADWKGLWGGGYGLLPSHLAKQNGWTGTPATVPNSWNKYFVNTVPKVSGGPFTIQSYLPNKAVVMTANPSYYGAKPKLDKLVFAIITDSTQEPTALQNHEVDAIYPQPELDLLNQVKAIQGVNWQLDSGLQFEHFDFNFKVPALQNKALRQALFTAVDRKSIVARTVQQFDPQVQLDGSLIFVPPQKQFYKDDESAVGLGNGDIAKAKQILTSAGYKGVGTRLVDPQGKPVPALRMRYTVGNTIRQTECQLFANAAKQLGVTVNVQSTDSLGKTLGHADPAHDFDIVVFAYVGGPLFVSGNAPIYETGNGANIMGYSNPQVDSVLKQAVAETDHAKAADLMNQADKLIIGDAASLPLYEKPVFLAYRNNIGNIRDNATQQGPTYNAYEWGIKNSAT